MKDGTTTAQTVLAEDPVMADLIERYGAIELEPADDPFERLVVSIINQQLSTQSAAAIRDRVFDRFDITPETVPEIDEADLKDCGVSAQKVSYLRSAAETFRGDDLSTETFAEMGDEEIITELTQIHGVGVWTAKMFLISVLARPDVFPVEDLGIRRAMEDNYGITDRTVMKEKATEWAPYRSYAARYLWRSTEE